MDYKNSGVDIEAGYKSVELMKKYVKGTMRVHLGLQGKHVSLELINLARHIFLHGEL